MKYLVKGQQVDRVISELALPTRGVFLAEEAWAKGVSSTALNHRERARTLENLRRSIWRVVDHPWTWEAQLQAALFDAGPGSVVALRSAARLHGCYAYRRTVAVEVTRLRGPSHSVVPGRLRETRGLPPAHITVIDAFPVTTLARTVFDLAGDPDPRLRATHIGREIHERHVAKLINDAMARRGLIFVAEAAVLAALAKRGRNGTRLIRSLLERFGPQYVPTTSDTEFLFSEVVRNFNLAEPERQVPLSGPEGWIGTFDFYFRAWRLVVEIDSTWHDGPLDRERDAERDRLLAAAGYLVPRFRYRDLVLRPEWVIRRILATVA